MTRHMTTMQIVTVALGMILVVWFITAENGKHEPIIQALKERATQDSIRAHDAKVQADALRDTVQLLKADVEVTERRYRRQVTGLRQQLLDAEQVSQDTTVDEDSLRITLQRTSEQARSALDSANVLLSKYTDLFESSERESKKLRESNDALSSQVHGLEAQIKIYEEQAKCSVLGVPCLTRWQAYLAGGVTVLAVITLLLLI